MADSNFGIDPNHAQIKKTANWLAVVLICIGIPLGLIGFCMFISVFFTGFGPDMDATGRRGVIGLLMTGAGAFMTMFGFSLLFQANMGRIARYQAQEGLPVAKDALRDVTPALSETVRELAGAVKAGSHSTRFCSSCGAGAAASAHFCEQCGAKLDSAT